MGPSQAAGAVVSRPIRGVAGLRELEWENPQVGSGEFWLVALGSTPDSEPRLYRLGSSGSYAQMSDVPFKSAIVTRFKRVKSEGKRRLIRIVAESIGVALLVSLLFFASVGVFQFRTVLSGSMGGTFEVGDVLVAASPTLAKPDIGDIVIFHAYNLDRTEFVADFSHRIVGGSEPEGWITRGDANESEDLGRVFPHDISGTVLFWIPKLGFAMQPQFILGIVILIMLAVTIGPDIREYVRQRRL
ncbi:S26 family signal peptidase [Pontimonas sp.]|nr:S26 family signal peptidase [Pontimonas sp.]MDA8862918.1 S26 family signal peptidase [Pontimonas sp.]